MKGGRAFNGSHRHVHHATIIVKAQLPIALHMGPMQRLAIVLGNAQCRVVVVVVVVDVLTPMLWHLDRSSCSHSCIATSGIVVAVHVVMHTSLLLGVFGRSGEGSPTSLCKHLRQELIWGGLSHWRTMSLPRACQWAQLDYRCQTGATKHNSIWPSLGNGNVLFA